MQGRDHRRIKLQQRLAPGADHQSFLATQPPAAGDRPGQSLGALKAAAPRAVHAHEVRIAEGADRARAIDFAPAPEIAAGEAAEHRRPPRLTALALEGQEDLLDGVAHGSSAGRPASVHSAQPRARNSHAGQVPQPAPQSWGVRSPR